MDDHSLCRRVLSEFASHWPSGEVSAARLTAVATGLSDARVWRVDVQGTCWALRRWPDDEPPQARLRELHRWLAWLVDAADLPLAPPVPCRTGRTWTLCESAFWQLEPWRPGEPELAIPAAPERVAAAVSALARLHRLSSRYRSTSSGTDWFHVDSGPAPAATGRFPRLQTWTTTRLKDADSRLAAIADPWLRQPLSHIVAAARRIGLGLLHQLHNAGRLTVPLFPCLRDARPDHFLFSGSKLTGIIDPSSACTDTAAADLSRLLAGYLPQGPTAWATAIEHYARLRPLSLAEEQLLPVLDASNTLLSGLHWVELATQNPAREWSELQRRRVLELLTRLDCLALH